ncbi:hypothetical protein ACPOL_2960 [Acidisarcina polymorpha]|uniref:Uncharacterized protein n=1 Tax=Acidisarcina polymorpha TaxID=2211140 RepID=A0A2Z5FZL3_9BACT|nr:hypothetical protein ACPOL_2960 [Acidisarcina polymorpha]
MLFSELLITIVAWLMRAPLGSVIVPLRLAVVGSPWPNARAEIPTAISAMRSIPAKAVRKLKLQT